jgi:hypothetical protein
MISIDDTGVKNWWITIKKHNDGNFNLKAIKISNSRCQHDVSSKRITLDVKA